MRVGRSVLKLSGVSSPISSSSCSTSCAARPLSTTRRPWLIRCIRSQLGKDRKLVKQLTEKAVVSAGKVFGVISDYVVHVRKLDPADMYKKQWLRAYL